MKKHSERLTELCVKLLNGGLEDFSQREIFEMLLLFSGRNVEISDIEYLVGKYDSYGDLLSDKTVAIMSNGNENNALTGLIKLIKETVGLCINNENSEEQKMCIRDSCIFSQASRRIVQVNWDDKETVMRKLLHVCFRRVLAVLL